ncbi:MAG: sodium:solute symporter [Bacteroidetes bacterium]|jgi:sodium/pantothenate symporter|nr:sodium:solute symporter [Bacteroidota bacterium]
MVSSAQITGAWILIIVYVVGILILVFKGASKTKSMSDYALGSVLFSPIAVGLSLAASMTSAATFVINPGFIANYGISGVISYGIALPLAAVVSLIVLTKSFRKHGQTVRALTLAQWIGARYNSKSYAFFMGILALLLMTFIVLIVVALTKVIATALQMNDVGVMIAIVVFVFGYMMFGGANSMVYTNTIQAGIMIIVAVILLTSGYSHFSGGISAFMGKLAAVDLNLVKTTNPGSLLFRDFYEILFAQIVVGIAIVVQPHIITKSLLLKRESDVNKFLVTAVIAELLFFAVVIAGLYARLTFPDLSVDGKPLPNDGIIPAYVVKIFADGPLAIIVGLFVILGLISAGMSTLEGLIQSVSTTITSDLLKPLFGKQLNNESKLIAVNKASIVLMGLVTIYLSYGQLMQPKLSVGIFAQNGVYAYFSAAFIPVIFGIYVKNIKASVPMIASITAIIVHFSVYYLLPIAVSNYGWDLGFFTKFVQGNVRNPAIASSTAIVFSTIAGIIAWRLQLKKENV